MITVSKFGTFWIVYCRDCAWWHAPESWQEAEHLRAAHECAPEPLLRIELCSPRYIKERLKR
jgi:hypothetical protein